MSDTITTPVVGLGADAMVSAGEGAYVAPVSPQRSDYSVSVGEFVLPRSFSDLAHIIDGSGQFDLPALAFDAAGAMAKAWVAAICQVGATFSTDKGPGTGVNISWANIRGGADELAAKGAPVEQGMLCFLAPQSWTDLREDRLVTAASAVALGNAETSQRMQALARSLGYLGNYDGIDIFRTPAVLTANAGADRANFLLAPGALAYADAAFKPKPQTTEMLLANNRLRIGMSYDEGRRIARVDYGAMFGFAKGQDAAGVTLIADA